MFLFLAHSPLRGEVCITKWFTIILVSKGKQCLLHRNVEMSSHRFESAEDEQCSIMVTTDFSTSRIFTEELEN